MTTKHSLSECASQTGHEWVLIAETLVRHPAYELRSDLRKRVRRFYCKWCRQTVVDADEGPVGV